MSRLQAAIAATRFGMGARPGEIDAATADPRGWLKAQIRPEAALLNKGELLSAKEVLEIRLSVVGNGGGDMSADKARMQEDIRTRAQQGLLQEIVNRLQHAAVTPNSFAERWARFWSNHFTTAARTSAMTGLVGPFEREAIRPNVFGAFAALLRAATFHQGMLIYLDAAESIGPSTPSARRRKGGLNENLAREILELHTLGVGSGYTQADIIEFAKALTGWTVGGLPVTRGVMTAMPVRGKPARAAPKAGNRGSTIYLAALHEPGARTVLGTRFGQAGREQAGIILDTLAAHPATAKHIATKLARHFVSDDPPASAVAKIETAFRNSKGDLAKLAAAVVDLDEAWGETQQKIKTPEELAVSVVRAAGGQAPVDGVRQIYYSLGQRPFSAPSPAGWPDISSAWVGADAVQKRLEWANVVARRMARGRSPGNVLDVALGDIVGARTRLAVERAESAEQGFTIAVMSPEFQRR